MNWLEPESGWTDDMVDATHHQEHKVLKTADTAEFDMRNLYPASSLSLHVGLVEITVDAYKRMHRPCNLEVKVKGPGEVLPRADSHVCQTVFPRNPWKYIESVHVSQKNPKKPKEPKKPPKTTKTGKQKNPYKKQNKPHITFVFVKRKLLPLLNYKKLGWSVNFLRYSVIGK